MVDIKVFGIGKDWQMAKFFKTLFIIVGLILIVTAGCNKQQKTTTGEKISDKELTSTADRQKTAILKDIDRKYENPKAHYELGKLYHSQGLWDNAEWEYNKTLAFDPMHHEAQASIVKLLIDKDDTTRSQIIADMYMSQSSVSAKHSLLLGRAFQDRALDDYALACYKQALQLAPNSVAINKQIGYCYLLKRDDANAEIYLRRAFDLDSSQAEIAGELGRLGVRVQTPQKKPKSVKKLDKIVEGQDQKK
jgi:Tfp pilus assembly protein PilF